MGLYVRLVTIGMAAFNVIAITSDPATFVAEVLKHTGEQPTNRREIYVTFARL
jgi:hypothetical protein